MLPAKQCSFVLRNPPFFESKKQTAEQQEQIKQIAGNKNKSSALDFVCGWFIKASQYITKQTQVGFASTNSITQGEQVGQLWTIMSDAGTEINFACKSFKCDSETRDKAQVSVDVIGFTKNPIIKKTTLPYC